MAVGCYTTLTQRANVVFEYRILEGRIEKILNLLIIFKIGGYENTMIWKKNGGYEIIFIWNFLEPEPEPEPEPKIANYFGSGSGQKGRLLPAPARGSGSATLIKSIVTKTAPNSPSPKKYFSGKI